MRRLKDQHPAESVLEVVAPRTNTARLSSAEHLFATLVNRGQRQSGAVSMEIVGDCEQRRFLARSARPDDLRSVAAQLGAAYPQAVLRSFDSASFPSGDPVQAGEDEQVAAVTLQLRTGPHLPLRTFDDRELDARLRSPQSDPILGILGALADLPRGWRALSQLVVLEPASPDWARAFQRLALERPLEQQYRGDRGPSLVGPVVLLGLVSLYCLALSGGEAWTRGDWLFLLQLAIGILAVTAGSIVVLRWLRRREVVDPQLVQAKLSRDACIVELRLAVFAPLFADSDTVQRRLDQLVTAYRPFALAAGNSLVSRAITCAALDLRVLAPVRRPILLNVRELAGLWHLPQAGDDVAFLERTTARRQLPLKHTSLRLPIGRLAALASRAIRTAKFRFICPATC